MIKNSQQGGQQRKQKGVNRSRSRSLSPQRSKQKLPVRGGGKGAPKSSRDRLKKKSQINPSLAKSQSKKSLGKSASQKKLKRSSSQPRIGSTKSHKSLDRVGGKAPKGQGKEAAREKAREPVGEGRGKVKTKETKPAQQESPSNLVKSDEKEMGIIFVRPEHDRIVFKGLDITDPVLDKYLEMINNDNDANYVMNALPELRSLKKEDESEGRDFVSGRISRLSGIFQGLSVDKIITPMKRVPNYYSGQCGKNLSLLRVMLQTKFKVQVDVGFLQYSLDGDKLTIFRIYVSKIYRRMNYVGIIYLQSLKALMGRHPGADRWSMFILERNMTVHKFFKYLGFHIEKIATESKNKTVDYFQEFSIKKKELNTVVASMTK